MLYIKMCIQATKTGWFVFIKLPSMTCLKKIIWLLWDNQVCLFNSLMIIYSEKKKCSFYVTSVLVRVLQQNI